MKKHLLFLFTALLPMLASAQTKVEIDGIWYNLVSKAKQAEVTSSDGTKYSGSITIPATVTYDGVAYSVTSIGYAAFEDCRSLTAINIPEGVTSIENSAFSDCRSLTAITIPENSQLTSIGEWAFDGCRSLTAITLPDGVTSIGDGAFSFCESLAAINIPESVTSIGSGAFEDCWSLTAITIPENSQLTSIGSYAFRRCSSLTAITLPDGVTSIKGEAFSDCSSLTAITLPDGVTSIGSGAFEDCTSLTAINIPEGVTSIGSSTFAGCSSLTAITIPEGVTSIGSSTFAGCSSLTAITIPEGVTSIEWCAFSSCSSLTAITIPESVTSIGQYAFCYCSSLTAITIPKGVTSIGSGAFSNCSELLDVYCYAKSVPSTEADAFDGSYPEYATLHVPASALNAYKTTAPWNSFGKFETFEITVENITLNQSTATLTEGETLVLTAMVTPDDAADKSISWSSSNPSVATVDNTGKVTAIAPGTATITVTANDGSGVSAQCEVTVQELILGKCATPTINYIDGEFVLTCSTEGAEIKTIVVTENDNEFVGEKFDFLPTHTFTAYATKENYEDSDVATLTICWIPCSEKHESEETSILTIPAKPVLISARDGVLTLSGLAEGTEVTLYTTDGAMVAHQQSSAGEATFTVDTNQVYLVHIGDKVVKIGM